MKLIKRIMCLVMALALIVTLLPINVESVEAATEEYICNCSKHKYSFYDSNHKQISIKSVVSGDSSSPITSACGFSDIVKMNEVTSITVIISGDVEEYSFCPRGESNASVDDLFIYCREIGDNAFCNMKAMTKVNIREGVKKIGKSAFEECQKLNDFVLPNTINEIKDYAFRRCKSFINVTIPKSVTKLGRNVYSECYEIRSITIENSKMEIASDALAFMGGKVYLSIPEDMVGPVSSTESWYGGYFVLHRHNLVYQRTTTNVANDTWLINCENPNCSLEGVSKQTPIKITVNTSDDVFTPTSLLYKGEKITTSDGVILKSTSVVLDNQRDVYYKGEKIGLINRNLNAILYDGKNDNPSEALYVGKYTAKYTFESDPNKEANAINTSFERKANCEPGAKSITCGGNDYVTYRYYLDGTYTSAVKGDEKGNAKAISISNVSSFNISLKYGTEEIQKLKSGEMYTIYSDDMESYVAQMCEKYALHYDPATLVGVYVELQGGNIKISPMHHQSHRWYCVRGGNTLKYYCNTDTICTTPYKKSSPLKLTISAKKTLKEGERQSITIGTPKQHEILTSLGINIPQVDLIEYYSGNTKLDNEPTKPGKYTVKATVKKMVSSFNYEIVAKKAGAGGDANPGGETKPESGSQTTTDKKKAKPNYAEQINSSLVVSNTKGITVSWGKVKGATGYEVYAAYCGKKDKFKKVKTVKVTKKTKNTVKITKLGGKALDKKKNVKVYVVAYKTVKGKKAKITKSVVGYVAGTKNVKETGIKTINIKKTNINIKKGEKATIKATSVKQDKKKKLLKNIAEFRFATSNKKIAVVDKKGKVTAKGKGSCYIYVYGINGMMKKVKITVK